MSLSIVLIGMMGSGKTTVGKLLARRHGLPLADTDQLVQERAGLSVPDIFAQWGEARFRALELAVCQELSGRGGLIAACGGGLPMQERAISALKENGLVFWLDRDPEDIFDHEDLSGRPLAQEGRTAFLEKAAQRREVYARWADATIHDFTSPISTAARAKEAAEAVASWDEP